jgi:hypothetical protein
VRRLLAVVLVAGFGCDRAGPPRPANADAGAPTTPVGPCGPMECAQYDSPRAALARVVASGPLVLAVGEAHAPLGASVDAAAKRFATDLLPAIAPRASDLVVELMMPPRGCADAAEEVRQKQSVVTSRQAATDQDDYVAMGERARALGVVPDVLRPSCADMDRVRAAGDDAIEASLDLIARLSREQAARLVARAARSDADAGKMVVVYGGLLHNDLAPTGGAARWSYAPALDAEVGGRLVSLDLIVPEFIGDDASWTALPWRAHYDPARLGGRTTLFRTGDRSFVLVFPRSGGDATSGASAPR